MTSKSKKLQYFKHTQKILEAIFFLIQGFCWVLGKTLVTFFDDLKIQETTVFQTYPKNFEGIFFFKSKSSVESSNAPRMSYTKKSSEIFR